MACAYADSPRKIPYMDLLQYRQELLEARGILPPSDTCAMDLRVKPDLRDVILDQGYDYGWFFDWDEYRAEQKKSDSAWSQVHQSHIEREKTRIIEVLKNSGNPVSPWTHEQDRKFLTQFGFYPGFYNSAEFASYQVGSPSISWGNQDGYVFKVFFEFKNPTVDLTPDRYSEFSRRLLAAGFEGDSKVPLMPGWSRYFWNDLIVHAPTPEKALIAERVGLDYFGEMLSSYSRGVDVSNQLTNGLGLDWPHFLCTVDPSRLPREVLRYLSP